MTTDKPTTQAIPESLVSIVGAPTSGDSVAVGLASLIPQLLTDVALDTTRDVHRAVAARTFSRVPGSAPVRIVHDRIADAVYGTLSWSGRAAELVLSRLARVLPTPDADRRSGRGARTSLAILNGVLGDLLDEQHNPLAITMSVRHDAADITPTRPALRQAFPHPSPRVAVMLHGLVESDDVWDAAEEGPDVCYDDVLLAGGVTPVRIRYNSGRHISDNAVDLADLLDRFVIGWPVPIEELILIGHSMGGLVIRGAAEVAASSNLKWLSLIHNVVMLGTPHAGAPLEVAANTGVALAAAIPELAPFGNIIRRRSAGIKDLRYGYVARADWDGHDPDGRTNPEAGHTDGLGGIGVHNIGATLTEDPDHLISRIFGDIMVRLHSANGAGQPWAADSTITHIGGINHFRLVNHPAVADLLSTIITPDG